MGKFARGCGRKICLKGTRRESQLGMTHTHAQLETGEFLVKGCGRMNNSGGDFCYY